METYKNVAHKCVSMNWQELATALRIAEYYIDKIELDKAAFENMFPSEEEIIKESDFRVMDGAEPYSWAGGARWMRRKFLENIRKCNANQ